MGRIIITGGTGLIGSALTAELTASGYELIILSRNPAKASRLPRGARALAWDGRTANGWAAVADGATAIVNLAGATIARPPWTAAYKRLIRESRVNAGRAVVEAVRAAKQKPTVLIQASGVNYYGLHADDFVSEETPPGKDFLASVCLDWEASTAEVEAMGVRRAITRSGLVLSNQGGILPLMALPFRFFVGGPIGSGKQYWAWIHIVDEVGAIRFLIENEAARGAFNLSAPNPLTNAEFSRVLAHVLHRPAWFTVPGFAMKLALGELAELLILGGQRDVPKHLQALGYRFRFVDAEAALRDLFH
jgi:uncharacterized protein (TIGR01777 family)